MEITTRTGPAPGVGESSTRFPDPEPVVVEPRAPLEIPGPAGAKFVVAVLGGVGKAANDLAERAGMAVRTPTDYSAAEDALAPVVERYPWAVVAAFTAALGLTCGVVLVAMGKLWKRSMPTANVVADVQATTADAGGRAWSAV